MNTSTLEQILSDFDHTQRLEDAGLFVERPRAPATAILRALRRKPGKHFVFCGSIGSGKSTELAYLGRLLNQSSEPQYFVVGIDVHQSVDEVKTLRPAEMIMLIGAALVRTYQDWWSKKVPNELLDKLREAFAGAMEGALRRVEPSRVIEGVALMTWGLASADAGTTAKAAAGLLGTMGKIFDVKGKRTPIGGLTRASAREADPDVIALVDAVNDLFDFVRDNDGREPIVLVDGLDKIDQVQDLGTIRQLFCARLLSSLRASCIYSAPVSMAIGGEWESASQYFERKRLTNLVVSASPLGTNDVALITEGRARMREVVTKRLATRELSEADVFDAEAIDTLITASGGLLRMLIHLVGRAIEAALDREATRVELADAEEAIHEISQEFELSMNAEVRKELEFIASRGEPSTKGSALELLLSNSVLHYRNGHTWWAPAPLLARLLG